MFDLIKLLADGEFHSGNSLGESLGISRAAIWKRLQRVNEELGVQVQSVPGRGYRLALPLQLLSQNEIRTYDSSLPAFVHESVGSTNYQARQLMNEHGAPLVVFAEHQTDGKGRRGREWQSPFAQNLYMSYVWPVTGGLNQIDGLSLVVGVAVVRAIKKFVGVEAQLKWPNDVLINARKVAGILLELVGDPAGLCHVIIGIGVNVNMHGRMDAIDQVWTSLYNETRMQVDREAFAIVMLADLEAVLNQQKRVGFSAIKAEWLAVHAWQDKMVELHIGNDLVVGKILGIGDKGEIVLLVDGQECKYIGGELSLRLRNDS